MLRSFRVSNHKSFRDEAELLLVPPYDKLRPVVPVAAIFGANASGKSNLLDAISWMRMAVRTSLGWEPGAGVPRSPFRLDSAVENSSTYEVELDLDGVRYLYGFEVDGAMVHEEWLYAYPRGRKRVIFEREQRNVAFGSTVPIGRARSRMLSRSTRDNALFLTVAAHSNVDEVMEVYQWFRTGLLDHRLDISATVDGLLRRLEAENPARDVIVDLLRVADPGVVDVTVSTFPESWAAPAVHDGTPQAERRLQKLRFVHASGTVLGIDDQSAGTLSWMALASATLDATVQGAVLLVDELDQSLHPRLAAGFLDLFRYEDTNPHGAQLVFTTHDATLLSPVLLDEALRRDEIWFTEKRADGATELYPLSGFKPRKHENWERRYLTGSYGAVPLADEHQFHTPVERLHREGAGRAAA